MKYAADLGIGDHGLDDDLDAVEEGNLPGATRLPAKQLLANRDTQDENSVDSTAPTGLARIDVTGEPPVVSNDGLSSVSPGSLSTIINGVNEGSKMSLSARIAYIMENGQPFCNHCENYYLPVSLGRTACTNCGCGQPNDDHDKQDPNFSHVEGKTVADEVGGSDIIKEESKTINLNTTDDYINLFHKKASDSELYYRGYDEAMSGKELDEDLAILSDDYYNGYQQHKFYNKTPQQSVAQELYNIKPNSNELPRGNGIKPEDFDRGPLQLTDGVGSVTASKVPFPIDVLQKFFEV